MARIMIVEDNGEVAGTVAMLLAHAGHVPLTVAAGAGVIERIVAQAFDLLLTDIVMPAVDGWQIIRWMRAARPELPIIAMSGGNLTASPDAGLQLCQTLGVQHLLAKPFRRLDLMRVVDRALAEAVPACPDGWPSTAIQPALGGAAW